MNLKSLSANFIANIYAQFVTLSYSLLTIPLFLYFWSVDLYGEWIVLSALPSYLALSNMGLLNVAQNNMTMAMATGDLKTAKKSLDTVWVSQLTINVVLLLLIIIITNFIDFSDLLELEKITKKESTLTIILLSIFAMFNLQVGIYGGIYRAIDRNARGVFIINTIRLFSVISIFIAFNFDYIGVIDISICMLVSYIIGMLLLIFDTSRLAPNLRPGYRFFNVSILRSDILNGLGFMTYPLARAMTNQCMVLLIKMSLSSALVVQFTTLRTLVNTAFQISNLVNLSTWPEYSRLFGVKDKKGIRKLFIFSTSIGIWAAIISISFLAITGPYLLDWWTVGRVAIDHWLLILFLIPILFNSSWYTALTVFNATNRHKKISFIFLMMSVLVPCVSFLNIKFFNESLYSISVSFILMEIFMALYVLPKGLNEVEIGFRDWFIKFMKFPLLMIYKFKRHVAA